MAKKSTFIELYENEKNKPTSAQVFVSEIAEITQRSENTVRMWVCGKQQPDALAKSIIAKRFKTKVETLFPNTL